MRSIFGLEVEHHGDADRAGPKTRFKPFESCSTILVRNTVAEITCGTGGEMEAAGSRLLRGLDFDYCPAGQATGGHQAADRTDGGDGAALRHTTQLLCRYTNRYF
jgi:hypothetical protein